MKVALERCSRFIFRPLKCSSFLMEFMFNPFFYWFQIWYDTLKLTEISQLSSSHSTIAWIFLLSKHESYWNKVSFSFAANLRTNPLKWMLQNDLREPCYFFFIFFTDFSSIFLLDFAVFSQPREKGNFTRGSDELNPSLLFAA